MSSTTRTNSEVRRQRRYDVLGDIWCKIFTSQMCMHKRRTIAVLFLLLAATSFIVDLFGKGHWGFSLGSLLLSTYGFGVTIFTTCSMKERTRSQVRNQPSVLEVLAKHKKVVALVFFFLMGTTSIILDVCGKNRRGFLLASFLLSAFGFMITLYTTCSSDEMTTSEAVVFEISLSVFQLIITIIWLIIEIVGIKSNYDATIFPLTFAIIALVAAFQTTGVVSSTRFDDDDQEGSDLSITSRMSIDNDQQVTNPSPGTQNVGSSDTVQTTRIEND
ncbi:hypothetical protein Q3G72_008482 [Acer saccharum]|nr:hypothetical protein Q3G72_008482 [Acer saccharum]